MSESEKEARDDSSSEHAPAESGEPKRALADNTPPNGGLVAWLQVVAAFFLFFNPWGLVNSYGVFQDYYAGSVIHRSDSQLSWVGTFQGFLLLQVGILTGPLFDLGYFRELVVVGTFLITFGMMMTSLAEQYYQVFLAQGVVVGLGAGCLFVPSVAIGPQYFTTKKALAVGITASGGSVGGVLFPIIFYKLQPRIGFGWATRVLGFIVLGTLLISLALIRPRVKPSGRARRLLDLKAFRSPAFSVFAIGLFLFFSGLYFPFFYISAWAQRELGTDANMAFYLFTILNAGSVFGRIIPGLVADRIGSLNTIIPCLLVTSILAFAWISVESFGTLVVFSIFYGFFSGAAVSLPPTIVASIVGDISKVGTWMGMCFTFSGLGLLVGNPIAGAIMGSGEHFVRAQCYSGAMVMAGAFMVCGVRFIFWRNGKGLRDKI